MTSLLDKPNTSNKYKKSRFFFCLQTPGATQSFLSRNAIKRSSEKKQKHIIVEFPPTLRRRRCPIFLMQLIYIHTFYK